MRIVIRERQVLLGVAVAAIAAVAAALVSQHVFKMMPCPWCVFQRLLFLLVALFAILGAFTGGLVRRGGIVLALASGVAGIAAALWQQLHAVNEFSCNQTLADQIIGALHLDSTFPNVFMAFASCSEANVKLLGIPYGAWAGVLFAILGYVLLWTLRFDLRRGR
jgi:disulfide bond formation protein DsbB